MSATVETKNLFEQISVTLGRCCRIYLGIIYRSSSSENKMICARIIWEFFKLLYYHLFLAKKIQYLPLLLFCKIYGNIWKKLLIQIHNHTTKVFLSFNIIFWVKSYCFDLFCFNIPWNNLQIARRKTSGSNIENTLDKLRQILWANATMAGICQRFSYFKFFHVIKFLI